MTKNQNLLDPVPRMTRQSIKGKPFTAYLLCVLSILMTTHMAFGDSIVSMGPYVQNATPTSMVIMWQTTLPVGSHVAYWSDTQEMKFAANPQLKTQHETCLNDLEPNTRYTYLILSNTEEIFESIFKTAPNTEQSFRFVVYGDSRSNPVVHETVVNAIIKNHPDIVLHTGDLVGAGENQESWWPEFFEPASHLMQHTALFPILGNHEYFYSGRSWFSSFFALPNNEQWFAFTYGNVRFIGLDTNVSFYPGSVQYRWLEAELKSEAYQQSTWQIVYFHHPAFTASVYRDDPDVKQHLVPLFEAGRVDLVFSGHSHAYEHYFHHGIHYIVTGGGGTRLVNLGEDTEPPLRLVGKSLLHHCVVDINVPDQSLTLSVQENDGAAFDGFKLIQPVSDPNLPGT